MKPIRILQVVTKMDYGGLETMLMNYYRKLDRSKIQFDFLTHRKEKGAYDDEIVRLGGIIYYGEPIRIFDAWSYIKRMMSFFKAHNEYVIVHSHIDSLSSYVLYAAKKSNIPTRIAHSHNVDFDKDFKYIFRQISKKLIPYVATEFWGCSNEAIVFMFGKRAIVKNKGIVLKNAIDVEKFQYNPQVRTQIRKLLNVENDFVIGHVGRFCYQKNQEFLIKILENLCIQDKRVKLVLLGKGQKQNEIENLAEHSKVKANVLFLGERENVSDYLQAMDVFCFPSRYEGLGIAVLEAQASGLPCVVSEAIPDEAIITPLVQRMVGFSDIEGWSASLLKSKELIRMKDVRQSFEVNKYDIFKESNWLENKYIELFRNGNRG